jgi:hypothetical protein
MDTRLKSAAVSGWIAGLILTFFAAIDTAHWIVPLAVGAYAAGACSTICLSLHSVARHTRRAFYHQRRWDDGPEATVLQLLRRSDAVDNAPERPVAGRGCPPSTPLVAHVQHQNLS